MVEKTSAALLVFAGRREESPAPAVGGYLLRGTRSDLPPDEGHRLDIAEDETGVSPTRAACRNLT